MGREEERGLGSGYNRRRCVLWAQQRPWGQLLVSLDSSVQGHMWAWAGALQQLTG